MNTRRVVHLKNFEPAIEEIPTNWIRCSVLGEFRPPEEFMRDGKQVRTNCEAAYRMKLADMKAATLKAAAAEKSPRWTALMESLRAEVRLRCQDDEMNRNSVDVEVLIEQLKALPKGSKVVTRHTYVYDGEKHVDFETPSPQIVKGNVYSIGDFNGDCDVF